MGGIVKVARLKPGLELVFVKVGLVFGGAGDALMQWFGLKGFGLSGGRAHFATRAHDRRIMSRQ
jgi:hypothetical protein